MLKKSAMLPGATPGWTVEVYTGPEVAKPLPNRKDRRAAARQAARVLNRARKASR